jgi:hypothetical protein
MNVNIINLTGNPFDGDSLPGISPAAHRFMMSVRVDPILQAATAAIASAELQVATEIVNGNFDLACPIFIIIQMNSPQLLVLLFLLNIFHKYGSFPIVWVQDRFGMYLDTHDFIVGTAMIDKVLADSHEELN